MKTDAAETDDGLPLNPYFPIAILTLATFMQVLDTTIANVALPKIAGDLAISPNEATWLLSSYLVATAAVLPISGWLANYFGRKRYYMTCVFLFTLSSVLCGLATDFNTLILFRILQGMGGAGLAPSEQAIIADITPENKLGRAFSIYGVGIAVAPVMGPTLGGFITDTFSWHWIFFINLPIGIVSLVLTGLFVKETKRAVAAREKFLKQGKSIDWLGIALFISGIAALELMLEKGPKQGWLESDFVLALAVFAFFSLLIGIAWELWRENPAVDVRMFQHRGFAGACALIFVVSFVVTGSAFLIPYMAQTLLGYTAMDSGMTSLGGTIILIFMIQIVGYLIDKFDARKIILFGLLSSVFSVWHLATINLQVGFYDLFYARILQSFSLSFLAVSINTVAYYGIPPEKNNSVSALLNLARNTGSSFGIALTSTVLVLRTPVHHNNLSTHATEFNFNYVESINRLTQYFQQQGLNALEAAGLAQSTIWRQFSEQALMMAIIDAFCLYLVLYLLVMPLVLLLKPKKAGSGH